MYIYICVYIRICISLNIIKSKVAIKLECLVRVTLRDSRNSVSIALVRRVSRHEPRNNETQTAWRNMRRDRVMGHIFLLLSFTLVSKSTLVLRFFPKIPKKIWLSATSMNVSRSKIRYDYSIS